VADYRTLDFKEPLRGLLPLRGVAAYIFISYLSTIPSSIKMPDRQITSSTTAQPCQLAKPAQPLEATGLVCRDDDFLKRDVVSRHLIFHSLCSVFRRCSKTKNHKNQTIETQTMTIKTIDKNHKNHLQLSA
jgi:hypothetical protein